MRSDALLCVGPVSTVTMWALETLLSCMDSLVRFMIRLGRKAFATKFARVRLVPGMYPHVLHKVALVTSRVGTVFAGQQLWCLFKFKGVQWSFCGEDLFFLNVNAWSLLLLGYHPIIFLLVHYRGQVTKKYPGLLICVYSNMFSIVLS